MKQNLLNFFYNILKLSFVFCSPELGVGTRDTCIFKKFSLPILNSNCRNASTKCIDSMSPMVPPSSIIQTSGAFLGLIKKQNIKKNNRKGKYRINGKCNSRKNIRLMTGGYYEFKTISTNRPPVPHSRVGWIKPFTEEHSHEFTKIHVTHEVD